MAGRAERRAGVGGSLILDAEGLVKFANGHKRTMSFARDAEEKNAVVVTAASTLAEVLRGGHGDVRLHRRLRGIRIEPIERKDGRAAGELLGSVGMSGHKHALDALLATIALSQPRPAILLTSDPSDMERLTEEPGRPRRDRIVVVRV